MGIIISTIQQPPLIHVRATGVLTDNDIDGYYGNLKRAFGEGHFMKALIDLSGPELNMRQVSLSSIRDMARQFRDMPLAPSGTHMACVAGSTLLYGFVRVFMAHRDDHGIEILPFRKMEDALHWLDLDDFQPGARKESQEE